MSLLHDVKALWRWWLPPLVILAVLTAVLLLWLGAVNAPVRYEIL